MVQQNIISTYKRTWFHRWLSEGVSPINSLREDSTVRPEWLEALVNDVDMETSSSPEELLELGFWGFQGLLLLLLHEERELEVAWTWWWWSEGHQLFGGEEDVAAELSLHSSAILAAAALMLEMLLGIILCFLFFELW